MNAARWFATQDFHTPPQEIACRCGRRWVTLSTADARSQGWKDAPQLPGRHTVWMTCPTCHDAITPEVKS